MSNFIYDIQLGFLAFPLVALLLAVPYALYQYRRFGALSIWKTFVVFTFILYCLCAVSLIVFPLPADHSAVVESARTPQLHPFHVIEQIHETTDFSLSDRSTWGPALRSPVVYEAIFNVMLTVPLGAYLCYLFRCRWWMALLIGMATTLLFETSQLTGLFGLYAHPYRLFDVDDLILNTAGTMLGFWLMIPLAWALPSMDEVNEQARERGNSRVSLTRRALAAVVDLTVLAVLFVLAWIVLSPTDAQIAKALAVDPSRAGAKTLAFRFIGGLFADPMSALLLALGIGAVLFAVIPMASKGRTIGKTLVGIRIVKADGDDAPAWGYWVRYLASAFFLLIPVALVLLAPEEIEGVSNNTLFQIVGLVVVVWALTIVARVIGSFSGYPYVSLSEVVSGTRLAPVKLQGAESGDQKSVGQNASRRTDRGSGASAASQDEQLNDWQDGQAGNLEDEDPLAERVRQAREAYAQAGISSYAAEAETRAIDPRQAAPGMRSTTARPAQANQASDQAISDKQAALDSLLSVNYDEQHPVVGASANNAPTRAIPQNLGTQPSGAPGNLPTRQIHAADNLPTRNISGKVPEAAPTQQLGAHGALPTQQMDGARAHDETANIQPLANPTQRITGPSVQRRIRRNSRPDAGGTQVFKKR
ncbi:MAG: VanZ family protein [Eggerthellaceae bacterium]|nr:VanZ family protein [Eggerthellaceae bacterium]